MKPVHSLALFALSLISLPACSGGGSDTEDTTTNTNSTDATTGKFGDGNGPTGAVCPTNSTLTYENFAKGFFESYCTRCHSSTLGEGERNSAPLDHNFDKPEFIEPQTAHIDEQAGAGPDATNEFMPVGTPKPTLEERGKLSEWLACGAPEN